MPANEHTTMRLAKQVFHIKTAECALVFFRDDLSPAHLTKRFRIVADGSLLPQEDFVQAYDLLNTRLHLPNESAMALDLFESDFETESYKICGFFSRDGFLEFGTHIGIPVKRVNRMIDEIIGRQKQIHELLDRSFLTPELRI